MLDAAFDVQAWGQAYRAEHPGLKEFRLIPSGDDWRLDSIIVHWESRKGGVGSAAMRDLVKLANEHGKRIIVSVAQRDDYHGTTSRGRLVGFYKRFGFVENTGRRKDFTITAGMYRQAQPTPVVRRSKGGPSL